MKKHDGWTVKSYWTKNPFLVCHFFGTTRHKSLSTVYFIMGRKTWIKRRRQGYLKLVKVKLVEVE